MLQLIGGALTAIGSITAGNAAAAAENYKAEVAKRNELIARQQGKADMRAKRRENSRLMGSVRAAYGASGIDFTGSALDVFEDTAAEAELDTLRIGYQAELRALGYADDRALAKAGAKSAKVAGYLGAASAIAGTAASLAKSGNIPGYGSAG